MNNRRTYCWRKHVQKVMFDSSDSFSVLTGSNNGRRRFIEKVIRVQEIDSMGTASKDFIKRSLARATTKVQSALSATTQVFSGSYRRLLLTSLLLQTCLSYK